MVIGKAPLHRTPAVPVDLSENRDRAGHRGHLREVTLTNMSRCRLGFGLPDRRSMTWMGAITVALRAASGSGGMGSDRSPTAATDRQDWVKTGPGAA